MTASVKVQFLAILTLLLISPSSVSFSGSVLPPGGGPIADLDSSSRTVLPEWKYVNIELAPRDSGLSTRTWFRPSAIDSGLNIDVGSIVVPPAGESIFSAGGASSISPQYLDGGATNFAMKPYTCGDANEDGSVYVADVAYLIDYLFRDGAAPGPGGDCDGYELINLHDVAYLIRYIFCGGAPLICPPTEPPCRGITNTDFQFRYSSILPANAGSADIDIYFDHQVPVFGITLPVTVRVDGEVPTIDAAEVDSIGGQMYRGAQIDPAGSPVAGAVVMYSLQLCTADPAGCYHFGTVSISLPPEPENRVIEFDLTELPPQEQGQYINYPQIIDVNFACQAPVLTGEALPSCDPFVCDSCYADPVFITCPGGDAAFHVYIRDLVGDPIVGFEDIWIEFSNCDEMALCPEESIDVILQPFGPSDDEGVVRFALAAGYCDADCQATVKTSACEIATVPVRSFDRNGDLGVSLASDFDYSVCNDYNDNGTIDFADQRDFSDHIGHYCGLSPCERFGVEFELDPPTDLSPGQGVDLNLIVANNNFDYCDIGYVSFFASGFGTGQDEELIETVDYNDDLRPGQQDTISASYIVPGVGHGCLIARFTTDCCSTTVELTQCRQSNWHCTGDTSSLCYEFVIYLDETPIDDVVKIDHKPDASWQFIDIHIPSGFPLMAPDSVKYQICTPMLPELGDTAASYIYVYSGGDPIPDNFENRVVITSQTGDADGNCIVNVSDAVYLITYIFGGGPEPLPLLAGDVDCNGIVNISDAVYLITYIFGGGPPPCIIGS